MDSYPKLGEALTFLPANLRELPFWKMASEIIDHATKQQLEDLRLINEKYISAVSDEQIKAIFDEMGYSYLVDLMDTITNYDFSKILGFFAWVQYWKGSRQGYSLTLTLLGLNASIVEWWEGGYVDRPWTHDVAISVDESNVRDIETTLLEVIKFTENYVYSKINSIILIYGRKGDFASANTKMAGWTRYNHTGSWYARGV
jgi:hypothetical protein